MTPPIGASSRGGRRRTARRGALLRGDAPLELADRLLVVVAEDRGCCENARPCPSSSPSASAASPSTPSPAATRCPTTSRCSPPTSRPTRRCRRSSRRSRRRCRASTATRTRRNAAARRAQRPLRRPGQPHRDRQRQRRDPARRGRGAARARRGDRLRVAELLVYPHLAAASGARAITVDLDGEDRHDLDAMAPRSPRRRGWSSSATRTTRPRPRSRSTTIAAFAEQVPPHVALVLDEAYCEFNLLDDPDASLELLERHPNLVLLRTFSKVYGLAGLRVGFALCGSERFAPGGQPGPPAVLLQRRRAGRGGRGAQAPGRGRRARRARGRRARRDAVRARGPRPARRRVAGELRLGPPARGRRGEGGHRRARRSAASSSAPAPRSGARARCASPTAGPTRTSGSSGARRAPPLIEPPVPRRRARWCTRAFTRSALTRRSSSPLAARAARARTRHAPGHRHRDAARNRQDPALPSASRRPPRPSTATSPTGPGRGPGFGGTIVRSHGELVYTDHLFDAYGADDGTDAERLAARRAARRGDPRDLPPRGAPAERPAGQFGLPAPEQLKYEQNYGDLGRTDAADLREVRVAADGQRRSALLARTTTMTATDRPVAARPARHRAAAHRARRPPSRPEDDEGRVRRRHLPARRGTLTDLRDGPARRAVRRGGRTPTAGRTPSRRASRSPASTRSPSPPRRRAARPDRQRRLPHGRARARELRQAPGARAARRHDRRLLHAASTPPRCGRRQRALAARPRLPRGAVPLERAAQPRDRPGGHPPALRRLLPAVVRPAKATPLQLWLHWRGGTAHSAGAATPGVFRDLGERHDSIVVSPRGRGTTLVVRRPRPPRRRGGLGRHPRALQARRAAPLRRRPLDGRLRLVPDDRHAPRLVRRRAARLAAGHPGRLDRRWTSRAATRCASTSTRRATSRPTTATPAPSTTGGCSRTCATSRSRSTTARPTSSSRRAASSRQHERLVELGYRNRLYLFHTQEHFGPPVWDQWGEGARYMHQFAIPETPGARHARARHAVRARDRARQQRRHDARLRLRHASTGCARSSRSTPRTAARCSTARRRRSRRADPLTVPEAGGPTGIDNAGPYTMTGLRWEDEPARDAAGEGRTRSRRRSRARGPRRSTSRGWASTRAAGHRHGHDRPRR